MHTDILLQLICFVQTNPVITGSLMRSNPSQVTLKWETTAKKGGDVLTKKAKKEAEVHFSTIQ